MPSHPKAVLNRTIPLVRMTMARRDGTVRHESPGDFSRIRTLVICGCGFPHWEDNFGSLKLLYKTCFGNPDVVCESETPPMNVPEAVMVAGPLLKRFEEAGPGYAGRLTFFPQTVAALEASMISAEKYIRNGNGG